MVDSKNTQHFKNKMIMASQELDPFLLDSVVLTWL